MITTGVAWFAECDKCGERWGPYENPHEASKEIAIDGWLETDEEVVCYACQDTEEDE